MASSQCCSPHWSLHWLAVCCARECFRWKPQAQHLAAPAKHLGATQFWLPSACESQQQPVNGSAMPVCSSEMSSHVRTDPRGCSCGCLQCADAMCTAHTMLRRDCSWLACTESAVAALSLCSVHASGLNKSYSLFAPECLVSKRMSECSMPECVLKKLNILAHIVLLTSTTCDMQYTHQHAAQSPVLRPSICASLAAVQRPLPHHRRGTWQLSWLAAHPAPHLHLPTPPPAAGLQCWELHGISAAILGLLQMYRNGSNSLCVTAQQAVRM